MAVSCAPHARPLPPLHGAAVLLFGGRLDLNHAAATALEALPRIGPQRAHAIVASRDDAPFRAVGDLEAVPGIGPRTVQALRGWVRVDPATGAEASPRRDR